MKGGAYWVSDAIGKLFGKNKRGFLELLGFLDFLEQKSHIERFKGSNCF